jgi:GT2 family glycosyltransferase
VARTLTLDLANNFLYKKIIWIDSDISWNVQDFLSLYNNDFEIVSGAYLRPDMEVVAAGIKNRRRFLYEQILTYQEPFPVFYSGFGFISISNKAMNSLKNPFKIIDYPNFNEDGIDSALCGEDISWCLRIQEMGYKVWLDPKIRVNHHKNLSLSW